MRNCLGRWLFKYTSLVMWLSLSTNSCFSVFWGTSLNSFPVEVDNNSYVYDAFAFVYFAFITGYYQIRSEFFEWTLQKFSNRTCWDEEVDELNLSEEETNRRRKTVWRYQLSTLIVYTISCRWHWVRTSIRHSLLTLFDCFLSMCLEIVRATSSPSLSNNF